MMKNIITVVWRNATEFIDPNSCSCLDLSCFGFEDFCIECYKITIDFFLRY